MFTDKWICEFFMSYSRGRYELNQSQMENIRKQPRFTGIFNDTEGFDRRIKLSTGKIVSLDKEKVTGDLRKAANNAFNSESLTGKRVFCQDLCPLEQALAITEAGGIPTFIDVNSDDLCMDPECLEQAFLLYPDTKIVAMNNMYGIHGQGKEIKRICDEHGAELIISDAFSVDNNEISADQATKLSQIHETYLENLNDEFVYLIEPECDYEESDEMATYPANIVMCDSSVKPIQTRNPDGTYSYENIHGTASPMEIVDALGAFGIEAAPICRPMSMLPRFTGHSFITLDGELEISDSQDALDKDRMFVSKFSNDLYMQALLLPSDISMTKEEQMKIIDIVHACFSSENVERQLFCFMN